MESHTILDDLETTSHEPETPSPPALPTWKYVLLSTLSLGLYQIYWFYKFWVYVRDKENADIKPVWRALFGGIFSFALVDKIAAYADTEGIPHRLNSLFIGIAFLVLGIAAYILSRVSTYGLVPFFFSLLILVQPINVFNAYSQKIGKPVPTSFSKGQTIILIVGGLVFFLFIFGLMADE